MPDSLTGLERKGNRGYRCPEQTEGADMSREAGRSAHGDGGGERARRGEPAAGTRVRASAARWRAASARRVCRARRPCADDGQRPRRSSQRRRARAQWCDRRGRRQCTGARRRGDRWARHDLHARPDRYALASLDQRLPAVRAQRRSQARLFSRHREVWPALSGGGFLPERPARPRRGAGRRHHHDAQLVPQHAEPGARRRRDPRHARAWHPRALRLWQSARRAERPSRWTWPISPASSAKGCRPTVWSRSAFALATSATIPIRRAARSRSKWQKRNGAERANWDCRSRCTLQVRRSQNFSTAPGCSVLTCSSSIRQGPRPRTARSSRPRVSAIQCRRSANPAGRAMRA